MKFNPGRLAARLAAGLCCLSLSARNAYFPQEQSSYERYVAVDGACGWPLLNLLPSGKIAMLLWPAPNHGVTEGAVECWISGDQGRRWEKAGIPVPNLPREARLNHAGGVTPEGNLVVLIGGVNHKLPRGWIPRPSDPRPKLPAGTRLLDPIPAISRDEGENWVQYDKIPASSEFAGMGYVPFGQIQPLGDGSLGAMLYGVKGLEGEGRVDFFVSLDKGVSWRMRGRLDEKRDLNETTWIRLKSGELFAAARTGGDQHLEGFRSSDNGVSWKFERDLSLPGQHPAGLAALPDGRIVLTYGVRNPGRWAIDARIGDSEARIWAAPINLVDLDGSTDGQGSPSPIRDGGYPSTIVLPDGGLLTAYYCRGIPEHRGYHVGVVRWRLPVEE